MKNLHCLYNTAFENNRAFVYERREVVSFSGVDKDAEYNARLLKKVRDAQEADAVEAGRDIPNEVKKSATALLKLASYLAKQNAVTDNVLNELQKVFGDNFDADTAQEYLSNTKLAQEFLRNANANKGAELERGIGSIVSELANYDVNALRSALDAFNNSNNTVDVMIARALAQRFNVRFEAPMTEADRQAKDLEKADAERTAFAKAAQEAITGLIEYRAEHIDGDPEEDTVYSNLQMLLNKLNTTTRPSLDFTKEVMTDVGGLLDPNYEVHYSLNTAADLKEFQNNFIQSYQLDLDGVQKVAKASKERASSRKESVAKAAEVPPTQKIVDGLIALNRYLMRSGVATNTSADALINDNLNSVGINYLLNGANNVPAILNEVYTNIQNNEACAEGAKNLILAVKNTVDNVQTLDELAKQMDLLVDLVSDDTASDTNVADATTGAVEGAGKKIAKKRRAASSTGGEVSERSSENTEVQRGRKSREWAAKHGKDISVFGPADQTSENLYAAIKAKQHALWEDQQSNGAGEVISKTGMTQAQWEDGRAFKNTWDAIEASKAYYDAKAAQEQATKAPDLKMNTFEVKDGVAALPKLADTATDTERFNWVNTVEGDATKYPYIKKFTDEQVKQSLTEARRTSSGTDIVKAKIEIYTAQEAKAVAKATTEFKVLNTGSAETYKNARAFGVLGKPANAGFISSEGYPIGGFEFKKGTPLAVVSQSEKYFLVVDQKGNAGYIAKADKSLDEDKLTATATDAPEDPTAAAAAPAETAAQSPLAAYKLRETPPAL